MSWSIGPCPTTFGCLNNLHTYANVLDELRRAIVERDSHATAITGGTLTNVASTHFDRTSMMVDNTDDKTTVMSIKGIRDWIESYYGYFGNLNEDPMRPFGRRYIGHNLATFLTTILGYSAWKQSTANLVSGRVPIYGRTIEELRIVLESLLWGPLWYRAPSYTYWPGTFGSSVARLGYNNTGSAAIGDWKSSKSLAWTNLKSKISGLHNVPFMPPDLGMAGSTTLADKSGSNYRYRHRGDTGVSGESVVNGWNARAKIDVTPTKTGSLKLTLYAEIDEHHWTHDPSWTGSVYVATTDPGAAWYDAGAWIHLFDGTYWTGIDYVAVTGNQLWVEIRGWESNLSWTDWDYASVDPGIFGAIQGYGASLRGIWERGNYRYGNPDA